MEMSLWSKYITDRFSTSFKDFFVGINKRKKRPNYFEIINNSFDLMQDKLTDVILENQSPDILVDIPRTCASTFEFSRGQELIEYGRMAMRKALKDK